ncbi:MAG: DUF86 domain-containing protein [Chloroflexi bacterium]|nr:DUF86 domain-containing protein [Chloroflexota bacterium]
MLRNEQELSYLWDMQNAANEIKSFMRGVKFAKFEKTKVLRYAAERQLLVIGEAANHLSPQFRNKHPEIPWEKFIRMRNVIAHEYGETLISRVWVAATESVPELIETLKVLLAD